MVANPARSQLNSEKRFFLVPRLRVETLSRETGSGRLVSSRTSPPIQWIHAESSIINLVLTHGILPAFRDGVCVFRQSPSDQPESIGSRDCVPVAFTAESPPAEGQ